MTDWMVGLIGLIVPWGGSVEHRLGRVLKMEEDVSRIAERVDRIYEHLVEPEETRKRPGKR